MWGDHERHAQRGVHRARVGEHGVLAAEEALRGVLDGVPLLVAHLLGVEHRDLLRARARLRVWARLRARARVRLRYRVNPNPKLLRVEHRDLVVDRPVGRGPRLEDVRLDARLRVRVRVRVPVRVRVRVKG